MTISQTKIQNLILFFVLAAIIVFQSCSTKDNAETKDEHSEENHAGNELSLTSEQMKIVGIETGQVTKEILSGYIKVNGEIKINQDGDSKVGSLIPGRVKRILVKEGSSIRAGQTLAVIENVELINVQVDYVNAINEYQYAKTEYDRQNKLNEDNIGSKKSLNELETNYRRALANYKTLEEKLRVYNISKDRLENIYQDTVADLQKYYSITSPIAGRLVSRMITVGQYVEPSTDMFHIVNTSSVYADVNIFERDLSKVKIGQNVVVESSAYPDLEFSGAIRSISPVFDDRNKTASVRINISNKDGRLLPNMFITGKIFVSNENTVAVPVGAVEQDGDLKYVFVESGEKSGSNNAEEKEDADSHQGEDADGHEDSPGQDGHDKEKIEFRKVLVNTGIEDDKFVEIISSDGLKVGDKVVSKGTFYLKSELKKEELGDHDH